jgi:protease-4
MMDRRHSANFYAKSSAARAARCKLSGMTFLPSDPPPPQETAAQHPQSEQPTTPHAEYTPFAPSFAGDARPSPPAKGRSGWFWLAVIGGPVLAFILLIAGLVAYSIHSLKDDDDSASTAKFNSSQIGVIEVTGVILSSDTINEQLRKFDDDSSVKAIILHINSPGGGAAASQEIYHQVLSIRNEKKKPIIASIESVGASGAYYIASGCDKIYANEASVVGSIGVIMEWTNYGDLMKWAKLKPVVLKSGLLKDAGDPTRDMTPVEQAYFQGLVDNMRGQFVRDVATGRHVDFAKIDPLANGQVWTGQQALPLGIIDVQGGFRDALMDTAKQVGITGEPSIRKPGKGKHGLIALLNGDSDDADNLFPNPSKLLDQSPGFYFMWR